MPHPLTWMPLLARWTRIAASVSWIPLRAAISRLFVSLLDWRFHSAPHAFSCKHDRRSQTAPASQSGRSGEQQVMLLSGATAVQEKMGASGIRASITREEGQTDT